MKLIVSESHDPYFNLALEDYLLRNNLEQETLLLYTNRPCVVLGRFQNPWKECYLSQMQARSLPLVRRQSGGGTVYHDMGNLNFAFISPSAKAHKKKNLEFICHWMKRFDVELEINERFDIVHLKNSKSFKVSGSAFKETKWGSLHHCTLLIESNLEQLNYILRPPQMNMNSKAINSVRSNVINLSDIQSLSVASVIDSFMHEYQRVNIDAEKILESDFYKKMSSDLWIFGETPKFELNLCIAEENLVLSIIKSRIASVEGPSEITSHLLDKSFNLKALINELESLDQTPQLKLLVDVLKEL